MFACQRFHYYLYGRGEITAETDHKPLTSIFSKPLLTAPKRLQSMMLTLQNYSLKVVYKPGPDMHISDTLSRDTVPPLRTDTGYTKHNICSLQRAQEDTEQINQADYLNVTSQRLSQIRQHTSVAEGGSARLIPNFSLQNKCMHFTPQTSLTHNMYEFFHFMLVMLVKM